MKKLRIIAALGVLFMATQAVVAISKNADSMLMNAIEQGDDQAVQQAIDAGANIHSLVDLGSRGLRKFIVSAPDNQNVQQVTLLQYAVLMQASSSVLTSLIEAGADVNMKSPGNGCWTALSLAEIINPQAVPVLKRNGAEVTVCLEGRTTEIED